MATKTIEERLQAIEQKENRLKQEKKKLNSELSKKKRNERTKRLIETGAMFEKILEIEIDDKVREELYKILTYDNGTSSTPATRLKDSLLSKLESR